MANRNKARPGVPSRQPNQRRGPDAAFVLAPSDFAFLWDECPRCFYRKVALGESRPRAPFPSVFGRIDRAMKEYYLGERTEVVDKAMPPGVIGGGDRWVKSGPLLVPGANRPVVIRGRLDVLIDCDDGTSGVVDLKTTVPNSDLEATYGRQLHAYAMALEHPVSGPVAEVSAIGLLCFLPDSYEANGGEAGLFGSVQWIEVPRDTLAFTEFLAGVVSVLGRDGPPEPDAACEWCALMDGAARAAA